jgi:hypothetical protein
MKPLLLLLLPIAMCLPSQLLADDNIRVEATIHIVYLHKADGPHSKSVGWYEFKVESDQKGEKATGHVHSIGETVNQTANYGWDMGNSKQNIWFWWDTLIGVADLEVRVNGTVVFRGRCANNGTGEKNVENAAGPGMTSFVAAEQAKGFDLQKYVLTNGGGPAPKYQVVTSGSPRVYRKNTGTAIEHIAIDAPGAPSLPEIFFDAVPSDGGGPDGYINQGGTAELEWTILNIMSPKISLIGKEFDTGYIVLNIPHGLSTMHTLKVTPMARVDYTLTATGTKGTSSVTHHVGVFVPSQSSGSEYWFKMTDPQNAAIPIFAVAVFAKDPPSGKQTAQADYPGYTANQITAAQAASPDLFN